MKIQANNLSTVPAERLLKNHASLSFRNHLSMQERKALACACGLLFGALFPLFRFRDELAQQRALLARINNDSETCKRKMRWEESLCCGFEFAI